MSFDIDIQGHRGARGRRPENTWAAFEFALDIGTPTLEMDVVITKDDKVVVSHEPWFSRLICKQPGGRSIPKGAERLLNIYEMTYEEVAKFDCGSIKHPKFSEQVPAASPKPLLRDIIEKSEEHARNTGRTLPVYSIELKSRRKWEGKFHPEPAIFTDLVAQVIFQMGVEERSILQSFDTRILKCAKRHYPHFRLAYLLTRSGSFGMKRRLRRLGFTPHIYSPAQKRVNKRVVRKAHTFNMKIIPWTVNSTTRMMHLLHLGVDGLITDYPEAGLEAARIYMKKAKTPSVG